MSDVEGRPASTMSTERRFGIAISVALILGGVYWALTGLTEGTKTGEGSYPVQGDALRIDSSSAQVEVRAGDGTDIKVERQFERNVFGSDPQEKYDNGKLELRDSGCGFLSIGCKTTYVVTVPKDLQVTLRSSSGDVKVSGLTGEVDLKSSSGSIEVHDLGGSLRMKSSSGDLEAQDLLATTVSTESSSGDVDLDFAVAPQSVDAKASSGDVSIQIPPGEESYKLETDTASGDESDNVKKDPTATRTIKAHTLSGDVTVEYNR
jgi:ribosomal protein L6P/L9E